MKKEIKVEITEVFMAKASWDRCFYGTIVRKRDKNNNPVVFGKIKVNNGYIYAMAEDQWKLGEILDNLIKMILDNDLHKPTGITTPIAGTDFCLN